MNAELHGYVVTSVVYRLFVRSPRAQLDNGILVHIYVNARNEEDAITIAEAQARHDYFVDDYKFVKITKSDDWMRERLSESNFLIT